MKAPIEDQNIVSRYQLDASEVPSNELDEKILGYSKSQTKKQRKWWPQIGLAASVVFVSLLAPWTWIEENTVMESDAEFHREASKRVMSESAVPKASMRNAPNAKSMLMKAAPQFEEVEERETKHNVFEEVEVLLATDQTEQARRVLDRLLKQNPELEQQLPDNLKVLLLDQVGE